MSTSTSSSNAVRAGRGAETEQAADAAVDQACRMLRLPTMRAQFGEVADSAQREQLTYRGFLAELLMAECDDRDRRRSARRITAAGFPREKWPGGTCRCRCPRSGRGAHPWPPGAGGELSDDGGLDV